MAAIPFYKSVYGTHFLAGDSWRSRSKDYRAMAGATVSYQLKEVNTRWSGLDHTQSRAHPKSTLHAIFLLCKWYIWNGHCCVHDQNLTALLQTDIYILIFYL